ncbi:MAG: copper resistance protein CopC [Gemmatimonadaceae bacterium]|nr:copper resistance protein CopC [Gemmatimonadaceae bacterium]
MRGVRIRGALATLIAAIALTMTTPGSASAHGRLKSSIPAAGAHLASVPAQVRLDFSEAPELTFTMIRLQTADGRAIALTAPAYATDSRRSIVARVAEAMVAGTYVVMWQIAGDDGHPVRGQFDFVVAPGADGIGVVPGAVSGAVPGNSAATPPHDMSAMHHDPVTMPQGDGFGAESPAYVIVRWIGFVALLIVVGAAAFRAFVLRRLRGEGDPEARTWEQAMTIAAEHGAARLGLLAALLLATTLGFRLFAQSYAMHGASGSLDIVLVWQMIRSTTWGAGWMLQLVGVLLAGAGFYGARFASRRTDAPLVQPPDTTPRPSTTLWWGLASAGAVACAFSPALSGHASSAPRFRAFAVLADGVHVLAASSWLGTLAVVLVAGIAASRMQLAERRGMMVRSLITAFSPVALVAAGVATVTGVFAAWLHVGTIPNLWGTRYGITLLIKLGVLGVVTLTGFYNWKFVQPRLGTDEATMKLQRSARVEVAVAVLVLLVTAVLVASPTSMDASM